MYFEQESQANLVWICEKQNVICFLLSFLITSSTFARPEAFSGVWPVERLQSWLQVEIADCTPGENSLPAATE